MICNDLFGFVFTCAQLVRTDDPLKCFFYINRAINEFTHDFKGITIMLKRDNCVCSPHVLPGLFVRANAGKRQRCKFVRGDQT